MPLFHTTDLLGISEINPDRRKLREVLAQLDDRDLLAEADHPDVSLTHDDSGWMITLYPSGIAAYENLERPDEAPRHMKNLSRQRALQLWIELSAGHLDRIAAQPWEPV